MLVVGCWLLVVLCCWLFCVVVDDVDVVDVDVVDDVVVDVVVVEWLYYSKRIIIDKRADLSEFFSLIFVGKMCVFVSRPMKIVTFLRKNGETAKRVVHFPQERDTFRWKSSMILTKKVTTTTVNPGNRRGFCV